MRIPSRPLAFSLALLIVLGIAAGRAEAQSNVCGNLSRLVGTAPAIDTVRTELMPVPHCYIHGTLGTSNRFRIVLPQNWNGNLVQGVGGGAGGNENYYDASPFLSQGFAYVESNQGHVANVFPRSTDGQEAWKTLNFIANHDVTVYSRGLVKQLYGKEPKFTFLMGSSGGGWRGLSLFEKYPGDYDGANIAVPAIELRYTRYAGSVMLHYEPVLHSKLDLIAAARNRGEDPAPLLTAQEQEALNRIYDAGWTKGSEFEWGPEPGAAVSNAFLRLQDRSYFDDFWNAPGYEGRDGHIDFPVVDNLSGTVVSLGAPDANGYVLSLTTKLPDNLNVTNLSGYSIVFKSGALAGTPFWIHVARVVSKPGEQTITISGEEGDLQGVRPGDTFTLNNRDTIAWKYYHRHRVSCDREEYKDDCSNGHPRYVQRPTKVQKASIEDQALLSGRIRGRLILMGSELDATVFHMAIKEYSDRLRSSLGDGAKDMLRVYWTEHGLHEAVPAGKGDLAISKETAYDTAFQLLVRWVTKGTAPPPDTVVDITPQKLTFPESADQRKGLQPTVSSITANGTANIVTVAAGSTVVFSATAASPIGQIAKYEWDFDGDGSYDCTSAECGGGPFTPHTKVQISASHVYQTPGTYLATVLVTDDTSYVPIPSLINRAGIQNTAGIQNLGRVVVIVK